jgi:hypothetical protein
MYFMSTNDNRTLTIEKPTTTAATPSKAKGNTKGKGREFSAELLAYVKADTFWSGGQTETDNNRPIWAMLGGTEQELRSFIANIQMGQRAALPVKDYSRSAPTRFEWLKSGGYRYLWQKVGGLTNNNDNDPATGTTSSGADIDADVSDNRADLALVTIYQPELFRLDPGMIDSQECCFVMLPPVWWVGQQLVRLYADETLCTRLLAHANLIGIADWASSTSISSGNGSNRGQGQSEHQQSFEAKEILSQVPQAAYFAALLDRRTPKPMPDNLEFYLQVYFYALKEGIATMSLRSQLDYSYVRATTPDKWFWARHRATNMGLPQHKELAASYLEYDTEQVGLCPGVAVKVSQTRLDEFLAEQVQIYFETRGKLSRHQRSPVERLPKAG